MKKSILIVEDTAIVAFHLEQILHRNFAVSVNIAESGEQALDFLRKTDYDLILMDVMLGGKIDGITIAKKVKEESNTCVVFITSLSDESSIKQIKRCGDDYFMKPFDDQEIIKKINHFI